MRLIHTTPNGLIEILLRTWGLPSYRRNIYMGATPLHLQESSYKETQVFPHWRSKGRRLSATSALTFLVDNSGIQDISGISRPSLRRILRVAA